MPQESSASTPTILRKYTFVTRSAVFEFRGPSNPEKDLSGVLPETRSDRRRKKESENMGKHTNAGQTDKRKV